MMTQECDAVSHVAITKKAVGLEKSNENASVLVTNCMEDKENEQLIPKRRSRRGKLEFVQREMFKNKFEVSGYYTGPVSIGPGGKRLRDGFGSMDYGDGEYVSGTWTKDELTGGRINFIGGTVYVGHISQDESIQQTTTHGFGRQITEPGSGGWIYTGLYKHDIRHGFGEIQFTIDNKFQLPSTKGKKNKKSKTAQYWVQTAGSRTLGFWSRDKLDGWAWYYYPAGTTEYAGDTSEEENTQIDDSIATYGEEQKHPKPTSEPKVTLARFVSGRVLQEDRVEDHFPDLHKRLLEIFETADIIGKKMDKIYHEDKKCKTTNLSNDTVEQQSISVENMNSCKSETKVPLKSSLVVSQECSNANIYENKTTNSVIKSLPSPAERRLILPQCSKFRREVESASIVTQKDTSTDNLATHDQRKDDVILGDIQNEWMNMSRNACSCMLEFAHSIANAGKKTQLLKAIEQFSRGGKSNVVAIPDREYFFSDYKKNEKHDKINTPARNDDNTSTCNTGSGTKRRLAATFDSDNLSDTSTHDRKKYRRSPIIATSSSSEKEATSNSGLRKAKRKPTKKVSRKSRKASTSAAKIDADILVAKLKMKHKKELCAIQAELDATHNAASLEQSRLKARIIDLTQRLAEATAASARQLNSHQRRQREEIEQLKSQNAMELECRIKEARDLRKELMEERKKNAALRSRHSNLQREVVQGGGRNSQRSRQNTGLLPLRQTSRPHSSNTTLPQSLVGKKSRHSRRHGRIAVALATSGSRSRERFPHMSGVNTSSGNGRVSNTNSNTTDNLFSHVMGGIRRGNRDPSTIRDVASEDCMPG